MTSIDDLPLESWAHIFSFLDLFDIARTMVVCTTWRSISQSHVLWKTLYAKAFLHPDALYNLEMIDPSTTDGSIHSESDWRRKYFERNDIEKSWRTAKYECISWRISDRARVGTQQFSQKEGIYATGSTGGKIFLYDINPIKDGKQPKHIITFIGHEDAVRGIQFDAEKLVSCSRDKTIRVWNKSSDVYSVMHEKYPLSIMDCKAKISCRDNVNSMMFKDHHVAAGFSNGDLCVIDLETRTTEQTFVQAHNRWIRHIQFSNNSIMTAGADGKIHLWDARHVASGPVRKFYGHSECVTAVQFHEGCMVSGGHDQTVRVWDMGTGICKNLLKYHGGSIRSLQFDNYKLVTGSGDCYVNLYEWNTGVIHCLFKTHGFVSSVRFSRDLMAISSADAVITMLRVTKDVQQVKKIEKKDPLSFSEF